jgi:hypothetical protein
MNPRNLKLLGEPDVALAGLRLWVHGREFEDSTDYWDANWLRVSAICVYPGASVSVDGPIVHLGEVEQFSAEIDKVHRTLDGTARLACIEPNLHVGLVVNRSGRVQIAVDITPNHLAQKHQFCDEVDQSYLPELASACRKLLAKYPIRGAQ